MNKSAGFAIAVLVLGWIAIGVAYRVRELKSVKGNTKAEPRAEIAKPVDYSVMGNRLEVKSACKEMIFQSLKPRKIDIGFPLVDVAPVPGYLDRYIYKAKVTTVNDFNVPTEFIAECVIKGVDYRNASVKVDFY